MRKKEQNVPPKDADLMSSRVSSLNKFTNDGNFLFEVKNQKKIAINNVRDSANTKSEDFIDMESDLPKRKSSEDKPLMSENQVAAKAMQLRMKGQHEQAEKLLKEAEHDRAEEDTRERLTRLQNQNSAKRYAMQDIDAKQKQKEEDSDVHLAENVMKNKLYCLSGRADDEYDYEFMMSPKTPSCSHSKFYLPHATSETTTRTRPFLHIALTATRSVDDEIWEEIRNFKKCLIMMFGKQGKDVIFLETVMDIAMQHRHCLIECIPVPQDIAKEAPLYFKQAIDEAEEEWSQHNAKRLIDTSQKGLRGSIPKNFPYFHVEFGLSKGFVHVIDDERRFNGNLGLNVVRGMLKLPEEDMHRRRRNETFEAQNASVAAFSEMWNPFDWTKQL